MVSAGGEVVDRGILSVRLVGNMRRRPRKVENRAFGGNDAVYGGQIKFAAFDGRVRFISTYDGAATPRDPGEEAGPRWRLGPLARRDVSGLADGATRQRVEIDALRRGGARLSVYGRHRASGQRFRLATDGLGPDQESVGYGIDAAFNALSLRFGYDNCDSGGNSRTGVPAFHGASDTLRTALSLEPLRPARGPERFLMPANVGYTRTERATVSFDAESGVVTAIQGRATEKVTFDWRTPLGATRLGIVGTRLDDSAGPAGGARTVFLAQRFGDAQHWHARMHLGMSTRGAPHATAPWQGDIYSGGLAVTVTPRDLPRLSARIDVAHFAMHLDPARHGNDWRLTTVLDFSALMPQPPGRSSRLRLSASVGQGNPFGPTPDTARALDGTVMLDTGFTF